MPQGDLADRAEALLDAGRAEDAAQLAAQGLAVEPEDEELLEILARARLDGDPAAALAAATRLAAVAPENPNGSLVAAYAQLRLGKRRAAERLAEQAVELAPWEAGAHAALAQARAGRRRSYRSAQAAAQHAVELAPDHAVGYVAAGNVELGRAKWAAAEEWYRRALEVDPANATAQGNLSIATRHGGNLGGAFANAQSVLRFDPADAHARAQLDETVFTTLSHLQMIVFAIALVVFVIRA